MSLSVTAQNQARRDIDLLLAGGKVVRSYPGTSQYALKGVSACGLASVNVVKNVLAMEKGGCTGTELVEQMMYEEFVLHAVKICQYWVSPIHLEVDDILDIPSMAREVTKVFTEYSALSKDALQRLLENMQRKCFNESRTVAAVLTKPPEIISIFVIYIPPGASGVKSELAIFAVFDSHSRPERGFPGSAINFFGTYKGAANFLGELLAVDTSLALGTGDAPWQAQLLSQYSAHILMASPSTEPVTIQQAEMDAFHASLRVVEMKTALNEMKEKGEALLEKYKQEKAEKQKLNEELVMVRSQLHSVEKALDKARAETRLVASMSGKEKGKGKEVAEKHVLGVAYLSESSEGESLPKKQPKGHRVSKNTERCLHHPTASRSRGSSIDADEEIAAALQRQYLGKDPLLNRQLANMGPALPGSLICASCFERHPGSESVILSPCEHAFCKLCLAPHVRQKIKEMKFPVICPVCKEDRTVADPDRGLVTRDIALKLDLTQENMRKWTELEMVSYILMVECLRCRAAVYIDRSNAKPGDFTICPTRSCRSQWCNNCLRSMKAAEATKHTCDGARDPSKWARERRWRRCPTCHLLSEWRPTSGDAITCRDPDCRTVFSYTSGRKIDKSVDADG